MNLLALNKKLKHFKYLEEIKTILILALPLITVRICAFGKCVVDTMMVGSVDKYNLAGMSLASGLYTLVSYFGVGISLALIPVYSSLIAKKDFKKVGFYLFQSHYLLILMGIITSTFLYNCDFLFTYLNLEDKTKEIAKEYLQVVAFFQTFIFIMFSLKTILISLMKGKVLLIITVISFLSNIPYNLIFVYGWGGFVEPMGAKGAAIASILCSFLELLTITLYCLFSRETSRLFGLFKPDFTEIKSIFRLGFPLSISSLIESSFFLIIGFLAAEFGEVAVSATRVSTTCTGIVFMLFVGISQVVTQRTAFFLGLEQRDRIKHTIESSLIISASISILFITTILLFSKNIAGLYTSNAEIMTMASNLLLMSIIYMFFDNIQVACGAVLRTFKENFYMLKVSVFAYWIIGLPVGFLISRVYGIYGYWISISISFVLALFLVVRKIKQIVYQ